jgi:hypothetical protein
VTTGEIVLAVIGGIMAITQALAFFILTDLRERIMRLEDKYLRKGWQS